MVVLDWSAMTLIREVLSDSVRGVYPIRKEEIQVGEKPNRRGNDF